MTTQAGLWGVGIVALAIAMLAAWRDHRRRTRADLDRVGAIDWRTVQMLALIAVAAIGYFLWEAR